MDLGFIAVVEIASAFQNNIHAAPVERIGVIGGEHFNRSKPEIQRTIANGNFSVEPSMYAVIAHQMCAGFQRACGVDLNHFHIFAARGHDMCQHAATDAAKSIDANSYCHSSHLLPILAGELARSEGHLKFKAKGFSTC